MEAETPQHSRPCSKSPSSKLEFFAALLLGGRFPNSDLLKESFAVCAGTGQDATKGRASLEELNLTEEPMNMENFETEIEIKI